jgi:hypothetical protein
VLPQVEELATVVVCEDDDPTRELLCDQLTADRNRAPTRIAGESANQAGTGWNRAPRLRSERAVCDPSKRVKSGYYAESSGGSIGGADRRCDAADDPGDPGHWAGDVERGLSTRFSIPVGSRPCCESVQLGLAMKLSGMNLHAPVVQVGVHLLLPLR